MALSRRLVSIGMACLAACLVAHVAQQRHFEMRDERHRRDLVGSWEYLPDIGADRRHVVTLHADGSMEHEKSPATNWRISNGCLYFDSPTATVDRWEIETLETDELCFKFESPTFAETARSWLRPRLRGHQILRELRWRYKRVP